MSQLRLTAQARRELRALYGPLLASIRDACWLLCTYPEAGLPREELAQRLRSYPVPPYVIFYRPVRGGGIQVIHVVHGKRDVRRIFKKPAP